MNRLALNLSMALLVALGLLACDNDEKPTGPSHSAPASPATAHPPALVSPHSGPSQLPEPGDIALPGLLPGPSGSALPRPSLDRTDLEQATEVVWGSMLGTEPSDPVVARLLADVPVLMSGIRQIKGRIYLYLGIGRAYYNRHGGEHIYNTLTRRFPTVPLYIEPSDGVQLLSASRGAQEEASPTDTLLADPFQAGLGAWTTTSTGTGIGWRAQAFDETPLPGAEAGNLVAVAQTEDCPENCALTLTVPLALSRYSSVTLSFDRWVDEALSAGEFLAVDLGNNGTYQRLDTYTDADGDSTWHHETYVIDADQLSSAVTVRFIAQFSSFSSLFDLFAGRDRTDDPKKVAIDNVVIVPAPGAVILERNLTVSSVTASPTAVASGDQVLITVTIVNDGDATGSQSVRVYRHPARTTDPTAGTRVGGATTGSLAAGASVTKSMQITAPTVLSQTTYYYYVCVEDTCGNTPATVTVQPKTVEIMGGSFLATSSNADDVNYDFSTDQLYAGATLTLGGLTDHDGMRGFVMSGHASVMDFGDLESYRTDILVFNGIKTQFKNLIPRVFLGKLKQRPQARQTNNFSHFFYADASFIAYPSLATSDCSLTWTGDDTDRNYCLDLGHGEQIETVIPLAIRGKNGAVYNVVGSQRPTMGLEAMFSGSSSGVVEGNRVTSGPMLTRFLPAGGFDYTYGLNGGGDSRSGDSGSPIYTVPDKNGNVRIIGILSGGIVIGGDDITTFNSWEDVMKELDLQPIR